MTMTDRIDWQAVKLLVVTVLLIAAFIAIGVLLAFGTVLEFVRFGLTHRLLSFMMIAASVAYLCTMPTIVSVLFRDFRWLLSRVRR